MKYAKTYAKYAKKYAKKYTNMQKCSRICENMQKYKT